MYSAQYRLDEGQQTIITHAISSTAALVDVIYATADFAACHMT